MHVTAKIKKDAKPNNQMKQYTTPNTQTETDKQTSIIARPHTNTRARALTRKQGSLARLGST